MTREPHIMSERLQADLERADPAIGQEYAEIHALVRSMSIAARETALGSSPVRALWWKRRRAIIPLGIGGLVALTGAAVFVPLGLWVNGTKVDLDAEIPIVYTTDTGAEVSCRYGFYFGDPAARTAADEELAQFVQEHDWTGIGQRVYDEAIANPFVPGADDHLEVDNQEVRDGFSFFHALGLVWEEIPTELQQAGLTAGGTSDCTGRLH